jgi:DNA-binding NarL/FixJ family response regulator
MSWNVNIIVVETSPMLYEGLAQIITHSGLSFQIKRAGSLNEAEKYVCAKPESLIIINPVIVQYNIKEFSALKNQFEKAHWMALIYMHHDQHLLSLFDGVISISDAPGVVVAAIKTVLKTEIPKRPDTSEEILSDREIEVLQLLANGQSNKEIAARLHISINTVITHRKNISQKTGIKTISGLTIYAVVNKLITTDLVRHVSL